ncbi:3-oxoacid CoA-transferase subunit A [Clostridium aestuarii]|uniref:3-oxoacid CoA-transferase subunit A n=1 Tax=Clostridium aestuarii TaxID=338193 RepID=A0ABT4D1P1_9CLOT|nr:3-oxoacid CoA-transferase subunit A [Clostridium aestuarii]MCY6485164.1 3-oxoacid CoA-transferase subunit A [Clostridium aestuarii]
MTEILKMQEAIEKYVKDNSSIMVGGFFGCNAPICALREVANQEKKDLTLIATANSFFDYDLGALFEKKLVKKAIVSHYGTNPRAVEQYKNGDVEVEYYPMGSFIEKIRCGGSGLGGVLTPTGIGTVLEKGKQKITVNGKEYLLETPIRADVAIIKGFKADKKGNIVYKGTPNANPIMAMAADITIAEVEEIVEVGELVGEEIGTPGIFVDVICLGYKDEEYKKNTIEMCKTKGIY